MDQAVIGDQRKGPGALPLDPARSSRSWTWGLGLVGVGLFALRAWTGYWLLPFGDELGHVLGAQAIHAGDVLYRDYVDAHGPAIFAATQGCLLLFGWAQAARIVPIAAAGLGALALGRAGPTWLGLIATVWILQGLYLDSYFPLGGGMIAVQMGLHGVPSRTVTRRGAALAGFAAAIACWTAYAFVPAVILLFLAGWGRERRAFLIGFGAGVGVGLAWMLAFGDLVGMLVFHVVVNQFDYAPYVHFSARTALLSLMPSAAPTRVAQALGLIAWLAAFLLGPWRERVPAHLLVALAVLSLDARGVSMFQDGTFLMAAFAWLAVAIGRISRDGRVAGVAGIALIGAFTVATRHAVASPAGMSSAELVRQGFEGLGRSDDAVSQEVRRLSGPGDRLLALPYDPGFFTRAGRLPVAKYHAYLPWEADYARHPWFGRRRDLCEDFLRLRPKLVRFEEWSVWGRYAPDDYIGCVARALPGGYVRDPRFPDLWVRRDLPKP